MSKITTNELTPGDFFYIRGKVTFSRISRHTTDEERIRLNENRKFPIQRNYTSVTLQEASVITADPTHPTITEQYAAQLLYHSTKPDVKGLCYTAKNTSEYLPEVRIRNKDTGDYDILKLDGHELANGLDVTLAMRIFATNTGNAGVSLDGVILNEDPKFYNGRNAAMNAALNTLGITFSDRVQHVEPIEEQQSESASNFSEENRSANTPVTDENTPFDSAIENPFSTAATSSSSNTTENNNTYRRY